MKRKVFPIICATLILFLLPANAFASTNNEISSISLDISASFVRATVPTQEGIDIPFKEISNSLTAQNSAINFSLESDDRNMCTAIGSISLDGQIVTFSALGVCFHGGNTENALLAELSGMAGDQNITLVVSYDHLVGKAYIFSSIGMLSATSAPIQFEFGEMTDAICSINEECIKSQNLAEDPIVSPEIQAEIGQQSVSGAAAVSGEATHRGTIVIPTPTGSPAGYISLFAPESVEQGKNFEGYAKLTTQNSVILNYIKNEVDSSATGPIRVFRANINMLSNDSQLKIVISRPESSTTTVKVFIPYLSSLNPLTVNFLERNIAVSHVTKNCVIGPNGLDIASYHEFYFGVLGAVANTDCGTETAETVQAGLSVCNWMSYMGHASQINITAEAELVAGYVGDGPRPDSRIVKSCAIGSNSITRSLSIL